MHTPRTDAVILNDIKYGRGNKSGANRLNMTVDEYKTRKNYLKGLSPMPPAEPLSPIQDRILDNKVDLDKGTAVMTRILSYEPMSAKEIEVAFKIDLSKWRLSTYWNKAQKDGTFLVSANVTSLKKDDPKLVIEDIKSAINEVFNQIPIEPVLFSNPGTNGKSLMVYTSDKHIGAYVPENGLYRNDYSAVSFAERMTLLSQEIEYLRDLYGTFENIYILDLGDSMDGLDAQTTRKGHSLPQNMSNQAAFTTFLSVHKTFFDRVMHGKIAYKVHAISLINDNHAGDYGYMCNSAVEVYLNTKYPQVQTKIVTKLIDHFTVGGHTFVVTHGKDDEDMKHGLPLHINDKVVNFIGYYLDYHDIDHKSTKVHFIKGDLHQNTSEEASKFRYRNVTSMFGSSKWAMHNFVPQAPGVSFDIVEDETERIYEYKMNFKTQSTTNEINNPRTKPTYNYSSDLKTKADVTWSR